MGHGEITRLLREWSEGSSDALSQLMPLVVDDLRSIARRFLVREETGHTLQPTALVNELYLKLVGQTETSWESRAQFYAFAGQLMRRILVDHARTKKRKKRGSGQPVVPIEEAHSFEHPRHVDLIALDAVLSGLERVSSRQSRIVELKVFVGLNHEEIGALLNISRATIKREWTTAKLWLLRELKRQHLAETETE